MKHLYKENQIIKKYDDGLVLRTAKKEDVDAFYEFNGHVHHEKGWDHFDKTVASFSKDLFSGNHPTVTLGDILITEDTKTGAIIASSTLIPQKWRYEEIEFNVGRPEIVGTHPDYRKRGFIRDQFEELHKMSEYAGDQLQSITGIPYYYRIFDYEMTIDLDGGGLIKLSAIPSLKEDQKEKYQIRKATKDDYPFIQKLYDFGSNRSLVSCVQNEDHWDYVQNRANRESFSAKDLDIIEDEKKNKVAFIAYSFHEKDGKTTLNSFEIEENASWLELTPFILRYFKNHFDEKKIEIKNMFFSFGRQHPSFDAMPHLFSDIYSTYAWYIRVPNIAGFLKTIKPVLERRLSQSTLKGYTGELKLNFYTDGVYLKILDGKIKSIEKWVYYRNTDEGDAKFPYLTFLHILFGHKSLQEVNSFFSDSYTVGSKKALINVLFPKKYNNIQPLT